MKSIAEIAKSYIGKTEKPANSGFSDSEFEKKMKQVGWSKSLAWCSFFGELVWKEFYAAKPEILKELDKLFSGSATTTFKNFDLAEGWETSKDVPVAGALAIWRHGNGWQGHLAVVTDADIKNNTFNTVEGNTNDKGGREGYIVDDKVRYIKKKYSSTGLNLVGFVYPK